MKKKTKQLLLLLLVLVVFIAAYLIVTAVAKNNAAKEAAAEEASVIHVGSIENPVKMVVFNGTDTMTFTKNGDQWLYEENPDFPLDSKVVASVASTVVGLTSSFQIEMQEDISSYGLDNPICSIQVTDESGETVDMQIGGAYGRTMHYASVTGEDKIYTVTNEFVSTVSVSLAGYYVPDTIPAVTADDLRAVTVTGKEGTISLECLTSASDDEEEGSGVGNWYVTTNGQKTSIYDYTTAAVTEHAQGKASDYINAMLSSLSKLSFTDCLAYMPDEDIQDSVGLKGKSPVSIEVTYCKGTNDDGKEELDTYTILFGGVMEQEGSDGKSTYYIYCATDPSQAIFSMASDTAAAILAVAQYCVK